MPNIFMPGGGARRQSFLAATLIATTLLVARDAQALQFFFENPPKNSYRSGVALLSGWACNAGTITLELVGTSTSETHEASYGTPRADTAVPEHCGVGDEDNGFGLLTNLNRLGTGPATATLKIDGVAVETHEFNITVPTAVPFATDLEGAYTLPGFPGEGQAVDAVWSTGIQSFAIAPAGSSPDTAGVAATESSFCPNGFGTQCLFENAGNAQFVSGIILFSGWICDVQNNVRLVLRGTESAEEIIFPDYGTPRNDTFPVCGDSNNGFGALSNANRLGPGPATAELWIDDVLAVTNSFWVTRPTDANFPTDVGGEFRLPGFPDEFHDTILIFQISDQNFAIKEVMPTLGATPSPAPGSVPTPGITPTPSPVPTATPTPTPTPTDGGAICGNNIAEPGEDCDGTDLGLDTFGDPATCYGLYGGYHPDLGVDECANGDTLTCASDCTWDGSLCSCSCEEDIDCEYPPGYLLDCGPQYCNEVFCDPQDIADCECLIGEDEFISGACLGSNLNLGTLGQCITTPFDPGENNVNLVELCEGFDGQEPDLPRCDYCDF